MDRQLIQRGLDRTTLPRFLLWLLPWLLLAAWGGTSATQLFRDGLYHTNMDNRFAFGLWIILDLAIIALGAGAFFLGFMTYLMRRHEFKQVLNTAVIVGFVCYSGAIVTLAIDVGQPIRAWFAFWHANVHSMLTEVTFCITCYLLVLLIEYIPIVLKNRRLRTVPGATVLEFNLHKLMVVFAGVGAFLSFFHQGSLGGMFGVLNGRPFAYREGVGIWPTTFFLFIWSAISAGPSFIMLITMIVQAVTRKKLVDDFVLSRLGRLSGILLSTYIIAKVADTVVWIMVTLPGKGFDAAEFYRSDMFGAWVLFLELTVFGLLPATILLNRRRVEDALAHRRRIPDLLRRRLQPLRLHAADALRAHDVVRPLHDLLALAAGVGRAGRRLRLRRHPLFTVVPLPEPVPARARTPNHHRGKLSHAAHRLRVPLGYRTHRVPGRLLHCPGRRDQHRHPRLAARAAGHENAA